MAAEAGCDWLLHIDSDEAFFTASGNAAALFENLADAGLEQACFLNFEALPEKPKVTDFFREVTLFKVNLMQTDKRRFGPAQVALIRQARFSGGNLMNFNLYNNGKSAGKIDPYLVPADVHRFARQKADGKNEFNTATVGDEAIILHYPNCGRHHFSEKYKTLGNLSLIHI